MPRFIEFEHPRYRQSSSNGHTAGRTEAGPPSRAPSTSTQLKNARRFGHSLKNVAVDELGEPSSVLGTNLDRIQIALDLAGLAPGLGNAADLVNAAISAGRGDWEGAGERLLSTLPIVGQAATAKRMAKLGDKAVDAARAGKAGKKASREQLKRRRQNCAKSESSVWKDLAERGSSKKGRISTGSGRNRRHYEWDHTHNDIEVYDSRGRHQGSMDSSSGEMYKPPVVGRTIDV